MPGETPFVSDLSVDAPPPPGLAQAVGVLLDLGRQARAARNVDELAFLAVNETHRLSPYRQAALWLDGPGVRSLSGVLQPEANAPYLLWLNRLCTELARGPAGTRQVTATDVDAQHEGDWDSWLPSQALWLPWPAGENPSLQPAGGLLLARDLGWSDAEIALLEEWLSVWQHARQARCLPRRAGWAAWRLLLSGAGDAVVTRSWWPRPWLRWTALAAALLLVPVRLTVLAPGELVPSHPAIIRAPLEGVIETFLVQPNQAVRRNQPLFSFDEALIRSRLAVASESLATAEAELRQTTQQALGDARAKSQLGGLVGAIEEKRASVDYLREQVQRARVLSPADGMALFDDPSEWIGRPVAIGERVMRIVEPGAIEVEAWLPLGDAIPLEPGALVKLYLAASPLSPVQAQVRYMAHDAVARPDGSYAYRVRATLSAATAHRVGLKGTAKLEGGWVPLVYWALRRPLATVRMTLLW